MRKTKGMKTKPETDSHFDKRPRNKANMDQPQEEFIQAQSSHVDDDDELQYAFHPGPLQWAPVDEPDQE